MAEKRLSITVRGRNKTWAFDTYADPKYIEEWREDGLEIDEVCNIIPTWVAAVGMVRPWCLFQDIFNFKNPWSKR